MRQNKLPPVTHRTRQPSRRYNLCDPPSGPTGVSLLPFGVRRGSGKGTMLRFLLGFLPRPCCPSHWLMEGVGVQTYSRHLTN